MLAHGRGGRALDLGFTLWSDTEWTGAGMDLTWSTSRPANSATRFAQFLAEKLTPEIRRAGPADDQRVQPTTTASLAWQAILHERGWAAPAWPVEHGGCDWSLDAALHLQPRSRPLAGAPVAVARWASAWWPTRSSSSAPQAAEGLLPSPHPDRRGVLLPGLLRAGGRVGPGRAVDGGRRPTGTTWCAPAARSGPPTPREANWMFAPGAHLP